MSVKHRHLEILAVLAVPCFAIWAIVRASSALDLAGAFAAVVGYATADFLAGALHWYCDERADPSWPWIGAAFIHPFRDHHERPEAITEHDAFELCGNNALVSAAILAAIMPLTASAPHLAIGVVALSLAVFATNVFHSWAHSTSLPAIARALQRTGVVLSPRDHSGHHATLDRAYCVTSGWTNPILDAAIKRVRMFLERRR